MKISNNLYRLIIILFYTTYCFGIVLKPYSKTKKQIPNSIQLNINKNSNSKKYFILDKSGLEYKINSNFIRKVFDEEPNLVDSIRLQFILRTFIAEQGPDNYKSFGVKAILNNQKERVLKFKKRKSKVSSSDKIGWKFTKPGYFYVTIPFDLNNQEIQSIRLDKVKGSSDIFARVIADPIYKGILKDNHIEPINNLAKSESIILADSRKVKYYRLDLNGNSQQFRIKGPKRIRVENRIGIPLNFSESESYILNVTEDGFDFCDYYIKTQVSEESSLKNYSKHKISKWRSIWINVPEGYHTYDISSNFSNLKDDSIILIKLREYEFVK